MLYRRRCEKSLFANVWMLLGIVLLCSEGKMFNIMNEVILLPSDLSTPFCYPWPHTWLRVKSFLYLHGEVWWLSAAKWINSLRDLAIITLLTNLVNKFQQVWEKNNCMRLEHPNQVYHVVSRRHGNNDLSAKNFPYVEVQYWTCYHWPCMQDTRCLQWSFILGQLVILTLTVYFGFNTS